MHVSVYKLQGTDDVLVGELRLQNGKVVTSSDDPTLQAILASPCLDQRMEYLTADANPKEWLTNLYRTYRNAYLRVSPVEVGNASRPQEDLGGHGPAAGPKSALKRLP